MNCTHHPIYLFPLLVFLPVSATTEIYTLSLHDALPICTAARSSMTARPYSRAASLRASLLYGLRSEEHTSELQSLRHLVCRLLLEKKKNKSNGTVPKEHEIKTTKKPTPQQQ